MIALGTEFPIISETAISEPSKPTGPDLAQGIALDIVADGGMIGGHVGEDPVLLARSGEEFFAIGSTCTHYGGPLADGLVVARHVRCPWHHARFSLRTGEAIGRRRSIRSRAGV